MQQEAVFLGENICQLNVFEAENVLPGRKMFFWGGICFVRENYILPRRKRFWGEKCFEVENVLSKENVFEVHPKLLAAVDVAWPTFQLHAPLDWSIKAVAFCLFKLKLKKKGVPGRSLQKEKNTEYLDIGDVFGWDTPMSCCVFDQTHFLISGFPNTGRGYQSRKDILTQFL